MDIIQSIINWLSKDYSKFDATKIVDKSTLNVYPTEPPVVKVTYDTGKSDILIVSEERVQKIN